MLRDYSIDLYLTRSDDRSPGSCDEVSFIVRARSIEDALQLAEAMRRNDARWDGWRLFEANVQEITRSESKETFPCVLRGPFSQPLVRHERKMLFGFF